MQKATAALKPDELKLSKAARKYAHADKARALLEAIRWPGGPVCPRCHFDQVYKLTPKKGFRRSTRKGVYKCAACRHQFTVTVGTVLEGSRLPPSKWVMAVFILCSTGQVISTRQLQRMLGITYKSTWRLASKLRQALGKKLPLQHLPANGNNKPQPLGAASGKGNDSFAPSKELHRASSNGHHTRMILAMTESPILLPQGRQPKLSPPLLSSKRQLTRMHISNNSSRKEASRVTRQNGESFLRIRKRGSARSLHPGPAKFFVANQLGAK